jgi:phosphoglycolate phosphatase-like HAD superfamily hydrolase
MARATWKWRERELAGGPAAVFDVDGVLADLDHRRDLLFSGPNGRKNWKAFFAAAGDDAIFEEVARLTTLLDPSLAVVVLTARPTSIQDVTAEWLDRHGVRWDLLVMRAEGDHRPSDDAKQLAVQDLRDHGFDLHIAFDDDRRNVDMFHAEGVPCIYIHSGYYER